MTTSIKTAGVIIISENKVLLVCHKEKASHLINTYGLPAGRVKENETTVQAAKRELHEETGFKTETQFLIKIPQIYEAKIKRKNGEIKNFIQQNFLCKKWEGNLKNSEETQPKWIKIKNLNTLPLLPNVEKMILDGLKFVSNQ